MIYITFLFVFPHFSETSKQVSDGAMRMKYTDKNGSSQAVNCFLNSSLFVYYSPNACERLDVKELAVLQSKKKELVLAI